MKKLIVALSVVTLLVAGCSGSDDKADPSPTAAATSSAEDQARQQAKEQAEQVKKAQDDLAKATAEQAKKTVEAMGTVVNITIKDGKATPQGKRVEVKVGDKVTLVVTSDVDEEIHVHSDPEHTYEASPGKTLSETFTLKRPGQVAVEAHHLDVTIVQLVVRP